VLLVVGCALMESPTRATRGENSSSEGDDAGVSGPPTGVREGGWGSGRTLAVALGLPALLGAVTLIVSDFEPLLRIQAITVRLQTISGGSNHSYAMVVLGLAALPMAAGATFGRSRPAAIGLIVLGLGALVIALIVDLPDTSSSGVFGRSFESATGSAARGFFLECAGGVLLVLAGVGQVVLGSRSDARRRGGPSGRSSVGRPAQRSPGEQR